MTELHWPSPGARAPYTEVMSSATRDALGSIHRKQIQRSNWPQWTDADVQRYPDALRRQAAYQWGSRATNEHGSIHQFTAVSHALCEARAPLELLGALARLITDEVRHAELCARIADVYWPEAYPWSMPRLPWKPAPRAEKNRSPTDVLLWASDAIMEACCFGETLSVPMLQALAVVSTEPLAVAVTEQILLDEHLHARFGWESVAFFLEHLGDEGRTYLQERLPDHMAGFERSVCGEVTVESILEQPEVTFEAPEDPENNPNLGTLTRHEYAVIFYHCLEQQIIPELSKLGLDPMTAWTERSRKK